MDDDVGQSRLLTAVSHDMRQPLQALLLYLGALERRIHDDEARAILEKADRSAQSLSAMVDGLAQIVRLNSKRIAPQIEDVELLGAFNAIAAAFPAAAIEQTALRIRSDYVLLDTILRHLVSNAIRHGGGCRVDARDTGSAIEISVNDDGPGIASEDQRRIFQPFIRLEGASPEGLGLGLTIVERMARMLGHEIEVRSAPGAGATFVLRAARA